MKQNFTIGNKDMCLNYQMHNIKNIFNTLIETKDKIENMRTPTDYQKSLGRFEKEVDV